MRKFRYFLLFFIPFYFSLLAETSNNYVDREILIKFKPSTLKVQEYSSVRSLNLSIIRKFKCIPTLYLFKIPEGTDIQTTIKTLSTEPDVLYAEPNYIYKVLFEPNDKFYSYQWALPKIKCPDAWEKNTGSKNIVIAVIDTGIDYHHLDLSDNIWQDTQGQPGYNAIENNNDPMDEHGHGTHCAGIIGAIGNNGIGVCGVNWQISLMVLKFIDNQGNGKLSDAIKCIDYIIDRKEEEKKEQEKEEKIVAVSSSWGNYDYSKALFDAIGKLSDEGILFVAASGNSNIDNDINPLYPASYRQPNIISVASSDRNDNRSSFSNYGRNSVHISAPGSSIYSTLPNESYGYKSGSSMSTPFVAGVAGLIAGYTDKIDAQFLKNCLLHSATRLPQWTHLTITGGRLNVAEALRIGCLPDEIKAIKNFTAERNGNGVLLSWSLPENAYVIIRKDNNTFPCRWDEGEEVYKGRDEEFLDNDVEEDIPYYYSAWAYYGDILQEIEEGKISSATYAYTNSPPRQPECILPENKAEDISLTPLLKGTAFFDPDNDIHNASQWQISKDIEFKTIILDKITSGISETEVEKGRLSYNTNYYWRVRYQDENNEWSKWADPSGFTTLQSSSGGGGCFIATAAFGSPLANQVYILRQFRDRYLLTNTPGRNFVKWYYKNGPIAANFITRHPATKIVVRMFLYPLVFISYLLVSGMFWYFVLFVCSSLLLFIMLKEERENLCV